MATQLLPVVVWVQVPGDESCFHHHQIDWYYSDFTHGKTGFQGSGRSIGNGCWTFGTWSLPWDQGTRWRVHNIVLRIEIHTNVSCWKMHFYTNVQDPVTQAPLAVWIAVADDFYLLHHFHHNCRLTNSRAQHCGRCGTSWSIGHLKKGIGIN